MESSGGRRSPGLAAQQHAATAAHPLTSALVLTQSASSATDHAWLIVLVIALLALLTIVGVAIGVAMMIGLAYAWPMLALGGFAAIATSLLVLRHRYAEAFLRMVAMFWSPLGLVFLFAYLIGPTEGNSRPDWALPAVVLGLTASVASVVAIYAGFAHLRRP